MRLLRDRRRHQRIVIVIGAAAIALVGAVVYRSQSQGDTRAALDRTLDGNEEQLPPSQRAQLELNRGAIELASGNSTAALVLFQRAYDRVLSAYGDHSPELAI